jgi:hypothetical protein
MWISEGRAFQAEGTESAKSLRQDYGQCVPVTAWERGRHRPQHPRALGGQKTGRDSGGMRAWSL